MGPVAVAPAGGGGAMPAVVEVGPRNLPPETNLTGVIPTYTEKYGAIEIPSFSYSNPPNPMSSPNNHRRFTNYEKIKSDSMTFFKNSKKVSIIKAIFTDEQRPGYNPGGYGMAPLQTIRHVVLIDNYGNIYTGDEFFFKPINEDTVIGKNVPLSDQLIDYIKTFQFHPLTLRLSRLSWGEPHFDNGWVSPMTIKGSYQAMNFQTLAKKDYAIFNAFNKLKAENAQLRAMLMANNKKTRRGRRV
jgi:hypothetical protein